jgi:DNA-binding XRE family transcriptional regulator
MLGVSTLEERLRACGPLAEIARKAETNRQTLYKAFERESEGDSHNLSFDTAQALAKATGKHVLWILTGEDPGADTLRLAQMVAHWLSQSHELEERDAWLLMQSLKPTGTTIDEIFTAAATKLLELGIPQRAQPRKEPTASKPAAKQAKR